MENWTGERNHVAIISQKHVYSIECLSSGSWCSLQFGGFGMGPTFAFGTDFFLHELTLKCFAGSFWGSLTWLSFTMQSGVYSDAHMLFF